MTARSVKAKVLSGTLELSTMVLLAKKYNERPIIPLDEVRADFFNHLTPSMFARKLASGEIKLPVLRIERSQKSPRSVSLRSLADYLDRRDREASETMRKLYGRC